MDFATKMENDKRENSYVDPSAGKVSWRRQSAMPNTIDSRRIALSGCSVSPGTALKRLGLPDYNPHDLRHKWATVTLSNGVPIHEVSRWMGHSSIKITVDRYGHLTLDGSDRCRQVIEATFGVQMLSGFPAPRELGAELVLA
ncbi:tyrosine-type recombinase/integrase [Streptomyces sioyaensis]|uniref:tyrosine-type recombinase/integrase n=1 Tax=Streptomyces sioyaensis TaxID=67364 RepID=UPI003711E72E